MFGKGELATETNREVVLSMAVPEVLLLHSPSGGLEMWGFGDPQHVEHETEWRGLSREGREEEDQEDI